MKYLRFEFSLNCSEEMYAPACDIFNDMAVSAGFEAFEQTPEGNIGYVQEEIYNPEALEKVIADFPIKDIDIKYTYEKVEDKDWNEAWENEGFDPIIVGEKLCVVDAKHAFDSEQLPPSAIRVPIEARMAFGSGTHQTTQMMLTYLTEISMMGLTVLDAGCGTGILGIAALKLDAKKVFAYDIDEWSVQNSIHNATLNGVENLEVHHGNADVLIDKDSTFDLVLANINRNILLNDMNRFAAVLKDGGTLLLSGFYAYEEPLLTEEAAKWGIQVVDRKTLDDWCCMRLVKKNF